MDALRIIPAYAGLIEETKSTSKIREDHPRIRGTNVLFGCLLH